MNIPEKYRERYDRLALAHPWMREMRDETETIGDLIERRFVKNEKRKEAVERLRKGESDKLEWMILGDDCPSWVNYDTLSYHKTVRERIADLLEDGTTEQTNGIDGETNGIADSSPLVDGLPEGDVVSIMRDLRGCVDVPMLKGTLCRETGTDNLVDALESLADMVEQGYVKLSEYERATRDAQELYLQVEAERDELRAELEKRDKGIERLKKRRDELTARVDYLEARADRLDAELSFAKGAVVGAIEAAEADDWDGLFDGLKADFIDSDPRERIRSLEHDVEMWRDRSDDMRMERDAAQAELDALRAECGVCDMVLECDEEADAIAEERDYWKQQVQLCMDAAYPPSHAPERPYDPRVMAYPDREGCTTPSTLVSAMIDGLRDDVRDTVMPLIEESANAKADCERWREACGSMLNAAHEIQRIIAEMESR